MLLKTGQIIDFEEERSFRALLRWIKGDKMDRRQIQEMDRWITGNYGEDQFKDVQEDGDETLCEGCGGPIPEGTGRAHEAPGLPAGEIVLCEGCGPRFEKGDLDVDF